LGFLFDMGNVLALRVDVLPPIASRLGLTVKEIEDFGRDGFRGLLVGAMKAEEFWNAFNGHFGTDVREDLLIACFHPVVDERVRRLILGLKAAGHRVVCGTNCFETHYRYHLEHGEYAAFDRVYASHLMGVAKPDPEFFTRILEQEGWKARDTFFLDDRAANIAAASELGIRSFLYESFQGLPGWLAAETGSPTPEKGL
jgi:glucose-1-phosphatase